jgi:hypothetical protein
MSMNVKEAVALYQYGDRSKSELIIASQLLMTLPDYKDDALRGAKRMLLTVLGAVRSEIEFGYRATSSKDLQDAINQLNEAISLVESDGFGPASVKIGGAISSATTVAQAGWQVISDYGTL